MFFFLTSPSFFLWLLSDIDLNKCMKFGISWWERELPWNAMQLLYAVLSSSAARARARAWHCFATLSKGPGMHIIKKSRQLTAQFMIKTINFPKWMKVLLILYFLLLDNIYDQVWFNAIVLWPFMMKYDNFELVVIA